MEEIQFLNYILSITSVIVSCIAIWIATQGEKNNDIVARDIKTIFEKIREINDRSTKR